MRPTETGTPAGGSTGAERSTTREALRAYFEGQRHLRKGICLLNAGQYESAVEAFTCAARSNPTGADLTEFLVRALVGAGAGAYGAAAQTVAEQVARDPHDIDGVIKMALLEWKAGQAEEALRTLRNAVAEHLDCAELHFQLGTMLATLEQPEEAELRFTQAVTLDPAHADARVSLALCLAARGLPAEAVEHLERAQRAYPGDARINLLVARAALAARDTGAVVAVRAEMPRGANAADPQAIARLSALLEDDPEFVEAFLTLDAGEVDETVFNLLAVTLKRAIEKNPYLAGLHYLRSKVLDRLGRSAEAIAAAERAVDLNPRYVQALILLAELYRQTDRQADAATRLEETVRLGVEYADTYFLLGNLYRDTGQLERARWAYENALRINGRYEAARQALNALAA